MRVLVTGAAGMVGRNLCEHPGSQDHTLLTPRRYELDLLDGAAVRSYVRTAQPDLVIHAAGRVGGIQANIAHPVSFLIDNAEMGRNLVTACREAEVPRLLNLASSCIYPKDVEGQLTEDMILAGPLEPTNEGYALAKIFVMRLCDYVQSESPGLAYKTLIPCNLFGPHDKFEPLHAHMVPAALMKIMTAARRGGEVEIWGDGSARREFMHADDLADFIWTAAARFDDLPDVMNVGIGEDHTVTEYYEAAASAVGWNGRFVYHRSRPVGMRRKLLDVRRQTAFGWAPTRSLQDGLRATYDYLAARPAAEVEALMDAWAAQ